jgi:hypothetical protein
MTDMTSYDGGGLAEYDGGLSTTDDPIEWPEPTGDVETDSNAEVQAVSDYVQRRKAEDKRFAVDTDSEYWFAAYFPSRDHKEAFLRAVGGNLGDKYIGGLDLADALGIEVDWP